MNIDFTNVGTFVVQSNDDWIEIFDHNDNNIYYGLSNDYKEWFEYDNSNNMVHYLNSDHNEAWLEYDEEGNEISFKDNIG